MTYCITDFQGLIPRLDSHDLPGNAATIAQNVDLSRGRIDPRRKPLKITDLGEGVCSAFSFDCCWIGRENPCIEYFKSVPCNHIYMSDGCNCPAVVKDWCGDNVAIPLGLPEPPRPEILSDTGAADSAFTELRTYLITYEGPCGEGCPSRPTEAIKADKFTDVKILIPPQESKYVIEKVNIYCSAVDWDVSAGYQTENQDDIGAGFIAPNAVGAEYFLAGTVDYDSGGAVWCSDNGDGDECFARSLRTYGFNPAPQGLVIFGETANGSLVGGVGTRIYFSERNAHWAWPRKDCKELGHEFCVGCVYGNTVIVGTDGPVFIILDNAASEVGGSGARTVTPLPGAYPVMSRKATQCTTVGMVFPSREGLIRVTPEGVIDNLSLTHYAPEDWWQLDPGSMRSGMFRGSYVFTTSRFSGIFDLNLEGLSVASSQNLTEICVSPECWINDCSGLLYYLQDGMIYQWEASTDYFAFRYRSAITDLPYEISLTAAEVVFSGTNKAGPPGVGAHLTVLSDGEECVIEPVTDSGCFRISMDYACDIQVDLTGTRSIRRVCVASDFGSLGDGG